LFDYKENRDMAIVRLLIGILIGGAVGAVMGYFGKCSTGSCPLTANPFRGAIYGAVMGLLLTLLLSAPSAVSKKLV
jgi:gas vesicle protein